MAKTRQIMTLDFHGETYICVKHDSGNNPYKLYKKWFDQGWHRKKVVEYADVDSVLFHLLQSRYPVVKWNLS